MAQGEFTKEEAEEMSKKGGVIDQMFEAIPKSKSFQYLGHLNDIMLFLRAAQQAAPSEKDAKKSES